MEFKTEVTLNLTKEPSRSYAFAYVLMPIVAPSKMVLDAPEHPKNWVNDFEV